jgi:hypothetical protein
MSNDDRALIVNDEVRTKNYVELNNKLWRHLPVTRSHLSEAADKKCGVIIMIFSGLRLPLISSHLTFPKETSALWIAAMFVIYNVPAVFIDLHM